MQKKKVDEEDMQKVRMSDIAEKLGVSTVTVHNALCGKKGVSEEMRAQILDAAKEMGYEAAPASRKKKEEPEESWKIGVIIAENYLAQYATSSIMDRYCGFMKALLEHHQTLPGEWLIEDRDEWGQVGFELPKCMPEAFVCNCDLVAEILIEKLNGAGYRVPEDISVIGFDNFAYPGYADMKITTYEVNMRAMTKVALDKMIKQIRTPGKGQSLEVISGQIKRKTSIKNRKGSK